MSYTINDWKKRAQNRVDLTTYLTHLTRADLSGERELPAIEVLFKILSDGFIRGSSTATGYIVGTRTAACFVDAPPYSLCETIDFERDLAKVKGTTRVRYEPFGLMFSKRDVYYQGGRPVIYDDTQSAKQYLPEREWWRIVDLDLRDQENIVDFTHEREWRVPERFEFDIANATVLVPNAEAYKAFHQRSASNGDSLARQVKCVLTLGMLYG